MGDFEYKSNTKKNFKDQMVTVDPEIKKISRTPSDDFIVLACDGIWDCLNNEECVDHLKKGMAARSSKDKLNQPIEKMFDDIIATDILSSSGIGTDNMTCVIVEFKGKK